MFTISRLVNKTIHTRRNDEDVFLSFNLSRFLTRIRPLGISACCWKLLVMDPFALIFNREKNILSLMKNMYNQMSFLLNIQSSVVNLSGVMDGKHTKSMQAVGGGPEFGTLAGWNQMLQENMHCAIHDVNTETDVLLYSSPATLLFLWTRGKVESLLQLRKNNRKI